MTIPLKRSTERLGAANLGVAMLEVVEVDKPLVAVPLGTAESAPVVGQHRSHRQVEPAIEGLHVIVRRRHRGLWPPADLQEADSGGAQVSTTSDAWTSPTPLKGADDEGSSREQLAAMAGAQAVVVHDLLNRD